MENFTPAQPWHKQAQVFVAEAWLELKKVTWPGRKEVQASTLVVLVVSALLALIVSLEDWAIHLLLKLFY